MKKFFRFGKEKKGDTPEGSGSALSRSSTASAAGSGATSVDSVSGYVVKEKDLPKLHKACWAGDIGKVKQLAKKDVLSLDKDNRTALHLACAKGHSTIVKELLEWKAKVNVGDNDAKTPLMKAAECDHARCAQLLLENRADPNIKDRLGMSALHYAAQIGNDGMLLTLLEPEHTDIDIQNNNGQTPLHLTILENHFDAGKTLLEEGCNPDVADADGRTPLILAAQEGLPEFVKIILACEADTLAKDKKGWTADDIAIMNSHDDCKEIIQQYNMKNNIASPRSNVTVPSVAGAPASDEPVELSEASRLSEPAAAGGDSWADTDEDSDAPGARKRQASIHQKSQPPSEDAIKEEVIEDLVSLSHEGEIDLQVVDEASGISLMEEMDKRSKHSPVGSPASRNRPQSSSKKTPTASPKSQSPPPPGSPKTTVPTSARSASDKELSFRDVDDNWSDNESDSLFSSQQDKKGKVSLVKLANQKAPAPAMKPSPLSQSPPKDQLDSWGDDDDSLSFPMAGGNTKKNNVPKLPVSALAQEKNKKPTIADLDLSDVSDISDLNDGPKPVVGASASKDTLTGESEWDTTPSAQPAPATAGRAPPLSARSQNVSSWGDSDDDDIPEIPKIPSKDAKEKDANAQAPKSNSPSQEDEANLLSPPTPFASTDDVTEMKEADDRWDSESDIPSTPKVPSQKISLPIKSNKVEQESLLDDDWDTSSEIESIEGAPNNFIGLSPQLQPKILKPSPLIDEKVFDKNTGAVSDVQPFNMTVEDDDWDSDIESKLDPSSGKSGLNEISKQKENHGLPKERQSSQDASANVGDENDESESDFSMNSAGKQELENVDPLLMKRIKKSGLVDESPRSYTRDEILSNDKDFESPREDEKDDYIDGANKDEMKEEKDVVDVNEDDENKQVKKEEESWTEIEESSLDIKIKPLKMKHEQIQNADGDDSIKEDQDQNDEGQQKKDETDVGESEFESDFSLSINIKPLKLTRTVDIPIDDVVDDGNKSKEFENVEKSETDDDLDDLKSNESFHIDIKPLKFTKTVDIPIDDEHDRNAMEDNENMETKRDEEQDQTGDELEDEIDNNILDDVKGGSDAFMKSEKNIENDDISSEESSNVSDEWQAALNTVKKVEIESIATSVSTSIAKDVENYTCQSPKEERITVFPDEEDLSVPMKEELVVQKESEDKPNASLTEQQQVSRKSSKQESEDEWKAALSIVGKEFHENSKEFTHLSAEKDDANIDQPNSSRKSSNIVDIKQDDDNSKWDSESDIEESPIPSLNKSPAPSRQEHPKSSNSPPPAEKAAVTGGMMMGDDDDDDDDETDDDEMEEESTWERENKLKKEKEAEKKRMEDEMKRIEEEKRHEEEHRKAEEKRQNEEKVKEEMRREEEKRQEEKREEERRKAEEKRKEEQRKAEEKRQKEEMRREEEKRQEEKREEERRKAEEKREEERRKVEQKRAEEHRKAEEKRLEAERKKAEDAKHIQQQVEAKLDKSGEEIQKLRALSDEDEEHSSSLRRKREQLERELEEAKKAKVSFEVKGKPKTAGKMHDAWDDDDDDDTFNDLDVPGMESPRKVDVHVIGTASPVRTAVLDNLNSERRIVNRQLSDDCLSYSSTEHDVSDHVPTSHGTAGHVNLSIASDSVNVMRLQEQLREAQRKMDKERNTKTSLEIKKKNLEKEKADVIQKLEDVTRAKSNLEKSKIDLEAKIRNLQYQFNEETEKRKNAEVLYAKTKEQLARKEEQYSEEIDSKQKLELSMRNLQMELRGALSVQKQVEEEKADLLRELNHEKNARILQEQINEEQLHFQKTLNEDLNNTDPRDFDKQLADAISKLDGSDEKPLNTERLKAELYAVKMELERLRSRNKDDHELLATENEELHQKIEDLRADIKLNEEALTHASIKYNMDLTSLSTANQKLNSSLDNEISVREKSEAELISVTSRLESCLNELEKTTMARSELERTLQRDKEDWSRQLERRDQEIDHLKENNASLQQQVKDLDHKLSRTENELSIANATLVERTQQLTTIQKELEARRCSQDSLDADWRRESEEKARLQARVESQQEKISCLQHENVSLQQQLDEARVAGSGYGDQFNQLLANMRTDHEKHQHSLQEKNENLNASVIRLKEELHMVDSRKQQLETEVQHLHKDLAETNRKLANAEASIQVASKGREQGDMEKFQLKNEIDKLASKLEDTKEKLIEANRKEKEARERAERVEQQQLISQQQAAGQAGEFNNLARSKGELEDKVHELELEKARMEAELRHQCQLVENLQRELQDANNEALATQTVASHEAEDAKALWETEVKSRSKLGLRMAQIERERTEAQSTNDEEKRKTRKAMELKKAAEIKYDNEHEKNIQLQKELLTLRKHLKVAKQRLKDSDNPQSNLGNLAASFDVEREEMQKTVNILKKQLEDLKLELDSETEEKEQHLSESRLLRHELSSLRSLEKSYGKMEKANKKLEKDLQYFRNNKLDHSEVEHIRAELEAKARVELNQKLEEVNAYLEEQARAREKLDRMRDDNESELRKEYDKTRRELLDEVQKLRESYQQSLSLQERNEAESNRLRQMYESELKLRERLVARLEKANDKAVKASAHIAKQRASSPDHFIMNNGAVFGKSTVGHGLNDLSLKIRQELDKSIAKHLEKAPHVDISSPPRTSNISRGSMSSPYNHSSSEYMSVLQRNYLL